MDITESKISGFYGDHFSTFYLNAAGEVWQLYDAEWNDNQIGIPVRVSNLPKTVKLDTRVEIITILREEFADDAILIGLT